MKDDTNTKNDEKIEEQEDQKKDDKKSSVKKQDLTIEELENKVKELEDRWKRSIADYRNLERRIEEEKKDWIKFANKDLLLKLFSGFEALLLAEKYVQDEGLKLSIKKLLEVLKDVGVERVKTLGEKYNADKMECIEVVDGKEDTVIEETSPGFLLYGKTLQPARVKVGKKIES